MISIVEKEVKEKEKEEEKPWKKGTGGWLVQSAPGKGRGVFREKGKRVGRGDLIQEELPLCCVLNDELVTTHCDGCFEERFVVLVGFFSFLSGWRLNLVAILFSKSMREESSCSPLSVTEKVCFDVQDVKQPFIVQELVKKRGGQLIRFFFFCRILLIFLFTKKSPFLFSHSLSSSNASV